MPRVPDNANNRSVAAILLREGGVVAYPTDTVYGLGASVFNRSAISTLYVIKGRDRTQGLPVLLASETQLREVATNVPAVANRLIKAFWPGDLTLVLPRHPDLPPAVTGGADTVAVRLPNHPCPQTLISACGAPITGTSANRHGGPEPISAEEVQRQLGNRLSLVLDGGRSAIGIPSTLLDLTTNPPRLIRSGSITIGQLREICDIEEPDFARGDQENEG